MRNVSILFNLVDLVFMDETLDISALFDEASSQEVDLARLQTDNDVKNDHDEEVSFVWTRPDSTLQTRHELVHISVDEDKFQDGARLVANFAKLAYLLLEVSFSCAVITRLESRSLVLSRA